MQILGVFVFASFIAYSCYAGPIRWRQKLEQRSRHSNAKFAVLQNVMKKAVKHARRQADAAVIEDKEKQHKEWVDFHRTARQADPAIKIQEIKEQRSDATNAKRTVVRKKTKKQHVKSSNARRSVVRKKTKKERSEATKDRRTVIRAARKPRMAVKRPADSFVAKEDKEKQEDEERQHKEWVDFHRMLARVAEEAKLSARRQADAPINKGETKKQRQAVVRIDKVETKKQRQADGLIVKTETKKQRQADAPNDKGETKKQQADAPIDKAETKKQRSEFTDVQREVVRVARKARKIGANSVEVTDQKDGKVIETKPRNAVAARRRRSPGDALEADVEDTAAAAKAEIQKIASEVEGMKSESETAKEGIKALQSKVEAEGEEVKRKAAAKLAEKEAELMAEKQKKAAAETKVGEGLDREEGLKGEIAQKEAEMADLKTRAEASLKAAEEKDEADIVAGREKARAILKEAVELLQKLKRDKETAKVQDATILLQTKNAAALMIEKLTASLKVLEAKLGAEAESNVRLEGKLSQEISAKREVEDMARVALVKAEEVRIHDAAILAKNAGAAEERLAELVARAEVDNAMLKEKLKKLETTAHPKANATAAKSAGPGNTTKAAAITTAAPDHKKPVKLNFQVEIDPDELKGHK